MTRVGGGPSPVPHQPPPAQSVRFAQTSFRQRRYRACSDIYSTSLSTLIIVNRRLFSIGRCVGNPTENHYHLMLYVISFLITAIHLVSFDDKVSVSQCYYQAAPLT